tara:strand:+ start:737 stop:5512 length:4776 start_codon:yes stop_codon:yes gene_type:complete
MAEITLTPIDFNPFEEEKEVKNDGEVTLTPVNFNPFEEVEEEKEVKNDGEVTLTPVNFNPFEEEDAPDPMIAELAQVESLKQADMEGAVDNSYVRTRGNLNSQMEDMGQAAEIRKRRSDATLNRIDLDEDELDNNETWTRNANTIYRYEKGENFNPEKEGQSLSDWFKSRQSALGNNITNVALTALDVGNMSDEVKDSYVQSMATYALTNNTLPQFLRGLKEATVKDPVFWATLVAGLGIGGFAKILGTKALIKGSQAFLTKELQNKILQQTTTTAAKKRIIKEDELIKILVKQGTGREAAEAAVKKGAVNKVSEEALKKAAKKIINKRRIKEVKQGAGLDIGYELADTVSKQSLEKNLGYDIDNVVGATKDYMRDNFDTTALDFKDFVLSETDRFPKEVQDLIKKKDFDYTEAATQVLTGLVIGGTAGWTLGRLGDKKDVMKLIGDLDVPDTNLIPTGFPDEVKEQLSNINIPLSKEQTPITKINIATDEITEANAVARSIEVDGKVGIDLSDLRQQTNEAISSLKSEAVEYKKTKAWEKKSNREKKNWVSNHRERINKISEDFKTRKDRIEKAFNSSGIELKKTGKNSYTGKKITEDIELPDIDVLGNRTRKEKVIAKIKQYAYDDGGLGDPSKAARTRKDRSLATAERNVQTRFKDLKKSIKKDYGSSLKNISKETYTMMTRALKGDIEAINILSDQAPKVLKSIQGMRENISYLQQQLLDSGAIKKGSDLEAKIISSMEDGVNPQLYITRQYEVFDNPNYPKTLTSTSEGQNVLKEVKQYLISQRAVDNKGFAEALKRKQAGLPLSVKQKEIYQDIVGKDGAIDLNIADILRVTNEDDLFKVFGGEGNVLSKSKASKILQKREDVPDEIRALMGEYQDPFTNYSHTASKIFQTLETFKYEEEIAKLIRGDEIVGAATRKIQGKEITESLQSSLPNVKGVVRPSDVLEDGSRVKPLEGLFGTPEVADYIAQGNEIAANWVNPTLGKFLTLQGYARAAKTVYSTSGLSRNFIGAGWMAFGAGYINPFNLNKMWQAAKGLSAFSDVEQRDLVEKGLALGFMQSGTDLGSFKGALKDAGNKEFWDMSSPVYKGGTEFKRKAKAANASAIKFYQSMDDMWKMFAFANEQGNLRRVLEDKGIDPDGLVREFMSGDGNVITITNLDQAAADAVNRKMQNYAGVPKFVKALRVTPIADFIAFKSEIIRTQKNIISDGLKDIKEGRQLQKESGGQKGSWQEAQGYKSLAAIITAQSAAAGVAYGSLSYLGDKASDLIDGIQAFEADYNKGSLYIYFGEPKNGVGKRFNLSYVMPWAPTQSPIIAGIRALRNGDDIESSVSKSFQDTVVRPITDTFGASMLTEGVLSLYNNQDEYGRPIWDKDGYSTWKNISNSAKTVFGPFVPGGGSKAADLIESYEYSGLDFGLKGKGNRKIYQSDAWLNMLGVGSEEYNIGKSLSFKMGDIKKRMGRTDNIFKEVYQSTDIKTTDDLLNSYRESMENKVKLSKELSYYIKNAKKAGMDFKSIFKSITKEGLFSDRLDKTMISTLIKEDLFIPPIPKIEDIIKWGIDIKKQTGQQPPAKEILGDLFLIWKEAIRK